MEKMTVLFQGDSVTDCGRDRENAEDLGFGYAVMAASEFSARNPRRNVKFINRGISGNRVRDLRSRWQEDCIDLKPDLVSIMIGINDTWRRFDADSITTPEEYERDYRYILNEIRTKLPKTKIVLMDPFFLPIGDKEGWREDLDPRIAIVRSLAKEFGAVYIPLDGLFAAQYIISEPEKYSQDGVHPNWTGHAFIADKFLEYVKL
mgnify:CR=1 FL=1